LLHLTPGDPARTAVPFANEQQLEDIREDIGLNKPFLVQYRDWLTNFVQGDFGNFYESFESRRPVSEQIRKELGVSLQLVFYAQFLALAIAIPLGVFAAYKANTWFDKASNAGAFGAIAIPPFVVAFILIFYLAVQAGWFPTQQYRAFGDSPLSVDFSRTPVFDGHFGRMLLPALSLAIAQIAIYMRLLRSDMIQTLQEDFITMARSKGLTNRRILWRHALRPSSLTLLTVAGLNVGTLIGGAVVVEQIFSIPGMGLAISQAIFERQYVALQSFVAVLAILYVVVNFAVDILYTIVDPRIRHARAR
jgi:peptide/nickel transport system permease protein